MLYGNVQVCVCANILGFHLNGQFTVATPDPTLVSLGLIDLDVYTSHRPCLISN